METLKKFLIKECEQTVVFNDNNDKLGFKWAGFFGRVEKTDNGYHVYSQQDDNLTYQEDSQVKTHRAFESETEVIESLIMLKSWLPYPVSDQNMHYVENMRKESKLL